MNIKGDTRLGARIKVMGDKIDSLQKISDELREEIINIHKDHKLPHTGSDLSCLDIMVALQFRVIKQGDCFILSKGHAAHAFYSVMHKKGLISEDIYSHAFDDGSLLAEHVTYPKGYVKTGSLGHGLPIGFGMALAKKLSKEKGNIYVILSDGEMEEGSTMEAIMQAKRFGLDNLIALVDYNGWQGYDKTLIEIRDLYEISRSMGWDVDYIKDGNNPDAVATSIEGVMQRDDRRPFIFLARTLLGKGLANEGTLETHYDPPK